ncbi:MAG: ABC transporter permease [Bacteroidales bacterium]|nr:ABC transporter permease [Bacteroidales bacterium]
MKRITDNLIKILSLGIGLAIGIVLIAKVCFELSYDSFYKDVNRIYLITENIIFQEGDEPDDYSRTSGAIAPGFKAEVPGVEAATRYTNISNGNIYDENDNLFTGRCIGVDTCFFDFFGREFLAGDPMQAIKQWNGEIAVSRSFAEKLGGVNEAIGKQVTLEESPDIKLMVTGVFEDFPENGSLQCDMVICIGVLGEWSINNWLGNDRYFSYVRLAPNVNPNDLKDAIRKMQEAHQPLEDLEKEGSKIWYTLTPFATMHRHERGVKNSVLILLIVAALLLLVSVLNYLLMAVSDVVRRSKEMGVRKCYGAEPGSIYGMLIKETVLNLLAALGLAALLIWAFNGVIESLLGVPVQKFMVPQTIWVLVAIVAFIFLVSALIPAMMFVRIPVSSAFSGYKENKRRWKLSLLMVQIGINAILLPMVIVSDRQYNTAMSTDMGYDYEQLLYSSLDGVDKNDMVRITEKLRSYPEVVAAEQTYCVPLTKSSGNNIYLADNPSKCLFGVCDQYVATEGFFDMMGFRLLEGQAPSKPNDVAVSRSFVEEMNRFVDWSDGAVGKDVWISEHSDSEDDLFTVCGVYEDYLIGSMNGRDERPSIRFCWNPDWKTGDMYYSQMMQKLVVKVREVNPETIEKVRSAIAECLPERKNIEVTPYTELVKKEYASTFQMRRAFMMGALFALAIALMGLIGFVRDESNRRSKEVAIRKVHGAMVSEIIKMFVMDVLKLALIAALFGIAIAYFVSDKWLELFAMRVSLSPLYFIIGAVAVLLIVTVVVVLSSNRVARMNPVKSLKNN